MFRRLYSVEIVDINIDSNRMLLENVFFNGEYKHSSKCDECDGDFNAKIFQLSLLPNPWNQHFAHLHLSLIIHCVYTMHTEDHGALFSNQTKK